MSLPPLSESEAADDGAAALAPRWMGVGHSNDADPRAAGSAARPVCGMRGYGPTVIAADPTAPWNVA